MKKQMRTADELWDVLKFKVEQHAVKHRTFEVARFLT